MSSDEIAKYTLKQICESECSFSNFQMHLIQEIERVEPIIVHLHTSSVLRQKQ